MKNYPKAKIIKGSSERGPYVSEFSIHAENPEMLEYAKTSIRLAMRESEY